MSTITTPDTVRIERLQNMFSVDMSMRLYVADVTAGMTPAQLAAVTNATFSGSEATFAGYAAITLTSANWGYNNGLGGPAFALYNALQTFERSSTGASQTVYGYWVRRSSDSVIRYFHKFDGPVVLTSIGHRVRFTPRYEA
jgi:hypothetical protein